MTGLGKIILEASIFFLIFASVSSKDVDPNKLFAQSIVNIPIEESRPDLAPNINTGNILNPENNPRINEPLKIQYIPVGNGEAILITANGYTMLLDGGENAYEISFLQYLRNAHIEKLDYLIITNPSDENIGLLDNIIKNIEIDKIYIPKFKRDSVDYNNLLFAMNSKNKSFSILNKYNQFNFGKGKMTVLHIDNTNPTDINEASIVLSLEYENKNFVFASNINEATEKKINWQKADVIKITSKAKTASKYEILAHIKPTISVIIKDEEGPKESIINIIKKITSEKVLYSDKNKIVQITCKDGVIKDELVNNTIIK